MDVTLKKLCEEHELTGIAVNVFGAPDKPYIAVYVHWDGSNHTCAPGNGDTFEEALPKALAEMAARQKQDADNAAEAAWMDQQQRLMETGGPDDSAYRRDMIAAGRGHLIGGAA